VALLTKRFDEVLHFFSSEIYLEYIIMKSPTVWLHNVSQSVQLIKQSCTQCLKILKYAGSYCLCKASAQRQAITDSSRYPDSQSSSHNPKISCFGKCFICWKPYFPILLTTLIRTPYRLSTYF
jgi:hypothetical protein